MNGNDKKQYEDASYEDYLERVSAISHPVKATPEQIEELRKQGYNV